MPSLVSRHFSCTSVLQVLKLELSKKRIRNEAPLTASPSDLVLQILWIQNHNTEAFIERRSKRQTRTYRALGNRPERDIREPGQTGIPICRNTLER